MSSEAFPGGLLEKSASAEDVGKSRGQESPLEEGMVTHCSLPHYLNGKF